MHIRGRHDLALSRGIERIQRIAKTRRRTIGFRPLQRECDVQRRRREREDRAIEYKDAAYVELDGCGVFVGIIKRPGLGIVLDAQVMARI